MHEQKPANHNEAKKSVAHGERLYIFWDHQRKNLVNRVDDLHLFLTEIFAFSGAGLGRMLSAILSLLINPHDTLGWKLILRIPFAIAGIILVSALLVPLVLIVLMLGTLAGIVGLRNVGEYSVKEQIMAWSVLGVFILTLPVYCSEFTLFKVSLIFVSAIGLVGLDLLYGQCGIISLGHGAFLLMGGYLTAWLYNGAFGIAVPALAAVGLGGLVTGLLGLILGLPALRVKDHYLVIVTLTFTIAITKIMKSTILAKFSGLQEGGLFLSDLTVPNVLSTLPPHIYRFFIIVLPALALLYFAYNLVHHSQVGRAFRTIRCDHEVSMIMGIPVVRYKLLAFVMSATYAGFAGGFLTLIQRFISPDSYTVYSSIDSLAAMVIGGPGSLLGCVFGGTFLAYEPDLSAWVGEKISRGKDLVHIGYGALLIATVLFAPRGLAGELTAFVKARFQKPVRRGSFQFSPPPDFDFLAKRREYFKSP